MSQRRDQQRGRYIDLLLARADESNGDPRYLNRLEAILWPPRSRCVRGLGWPAREVANHA